MGVGREEHQLRTRQMDMSLKRLLSVCFETQSGSTACGVGALEEQASRRSGHCTDPDGAREPPCV